MAERTRRTVILLGALIAYTLFFYRDVLFEGRVNVFRDQYTILLAVDHVVRLLSEWEWPPLWTPFQVLGKPLAAEPLSAVFYPPNWLLRLLPSPLGYNASLALHHGLAAAGMYALLRHRAVLPLAAAFGGLLFGFGGLFVGFDNMSNALQSATWLPWTVLAFDRWCARGGSAALVATAFGLALTMLGGMPEAYAFEVAVFVVLVIDRRRHAGGPSWGRAAAAIVGVNLLGLALSAVQLLPTLEYLAHSSRAGGLSLEGVLRLSLRPLGVLAFLLPRHYRDPTGRFHETAGLWEGDFSDAPWALTLYVGPLLVLAAAARWRHARAWLWLGVGVLFLALAGGANTPGYAWLVEHVPLLRGARYPEKFLLVVHGLLVVAAAVGLDAALRDPARFARVTRAALALAAAMLLAAALLSLRPSFARELLARDLAVSIALLLAIAALAVAAPRRPAAVAMALIGLAAVDLYRVNGRLLPTVDAGELRVVPPTTAVMRRGADPLRIYSDAVGRPPVPPHPDAFEQERNLLLFEVANYYGIANLNAPSSINLRDHERLAELSESLPAERVAAFFGAFNTAYVTSPKDLRRYAGLTAIRRPAAPVDAYVYQVDAITARAFVPKTLEPVTGEDAALAYLRGAAHPAARVAVEASAIPPDLPAAMDGDVELSGYYAHEVELIAHMRTAGLVVLSDTFYPGWDVEVDDTPAQIVRANHFARGVFVPAGEHRVVFRYRPWSFRIGAIVSTLACLLAALLVARGRAPETTDEHREDHRTH